MYDYSLSEKERNRYVLKYHVDYENDEVQVEFPKQDGKEKVFKNLKFCSENIQKLDKKQECQAQRAVKNKLKFRLCRDAMRAVASVNAVALGSSIFFTVENFSNQQTGIGTGCFVAAGALAFTLSQTLKSYIQSARKVKELDKIELLQENRELFNSISEYPNALAGLDDKTKAKIISSEEPFKVNAIDEYSSKTLNKIVNNMIIEQKFAFDYKEDSDSDVAVKDKVIKGRFR